MVDPLVIPIVAILAVFATISIGVVAHYVYLIQRLKAENALKQDMLMRGYSAEEIARVIGARCGTRTSCGEQRHEKGSPPENTTDVPPAKPIKQPAWG